MLSETSQKVLVRAIELLREPGRWIRGSFATKGYHQNPADLTKDDRFCMLGALSQAEAEQGVNGMGYIATAEQSIQRTLKLQGRRNSGVIMFNDNEAKNAEDCVAVMCETLKRETEVDGGSD